MVQDSLMQAAIEAAREGIAAGQSPFGAAIADADGRIIVAAHNCVRLDTDATAHAEIVAIRRACRARGDVHLTGCVMATTCEPCPMCAAAIHWAQLETVQFGATIDDAAAAGFNELNFSCQHLYREGGSSVRMVPGVMQEDCAALFDAWRRGPQPRPY